MKEFKWQGEHSVNVLEYMILERDAKISELTKIKYEMLDMLQALQDSIDELREVGLTQMADYHERLIKEATELWE